MSYFGSLSSFICIYSPSPAIQRPQDDAQCGAGGGVAVAVATILLGGPHLPLSQDGIAGVIVAVELQELQGI